MTTPFVPAWIRAHAWAAFEQGAWLAELDLLQLGEAIRIRSQENGSGYAGDLFDLMITIADVLEADHGWSPQQSEAWLERMGVWTGD